MGLIQSSDDSNIEGDRAGMENNDTVITYDKDIDLADVLILLANFNNSKVPIPLQLVVEILNYAGILSPLRNVRDDSFTSRNNCEVSYLALTLPSTRYVQSTGIRLIVNSKDQGWSSYPDQRGMRTSNTWGEVCLSSHPDERLTVFRNIHAGREYERQEIDMSQTEGVSGEQYQSLLNKISVIGDEDEPVTLTLVLRSQYPGWTISVNHAELAVSYQLAGDWEVFAAHCAQIRGR